MITSKITTRYAKSLLDLAIETNQLKECYNDLIAVETLCSESIDFTLMLKSPIINTSKKLSIIKSLFKKNLTKTTYLFIELITKKKRESLLHPISKNFIELYKSHHKIITANVTTTIPLDKNLKEKVVSFVKKKMDKDVELKEEINYDILGGAIIKVGDFQIDDSVRKQLKELKNSYKKNLFIKDF
jgi:F-type H+-transporting ATPase subunit delta